MDNISVGIKRHYLKHCLLKFSVAVNLNLLTGIKYYGYRCQLSFSATGNVGYTDAQEQLSAIISIKSSQVLRINLFTSCTFKFFEKIRWATAIRLQQRTTPSSCSITVSTKLVELLRVKSSLIAPGLLLGLD